MSRRDALKAIGAGAAVTANSCAAPDVSPRAGDTAAQPITIAGYGYDRVAALRDGRVAIDGCEFQFELSNIYELNATAMAGDQRFEVQEIGLHPYMLAFANDGFRGFTLIPVFPLRAFRHKSMFIRTDRGIETPADLRGKTVATPGYSQSSLVWIRGILADEYGLRPDEMEWLITASSDKGKASKNEAMLPDGVSIRRGPEGLDESDLLIRGDVDAAFVAIEPRAYVEGNPLVARLFADARTAERAYFAKTGIFPIMHAVAVRQDVVEENPWLPAAVFQAYSQAKQLMYQDLHKRGWYMISLPWGGQELEETRQLMGDNYWPYGIEANRRTLEALFRYSHDQGLAERTLTIEELFEPSTLALLDDG